MKLTIIDCRNQYLSAQLRQSAGENLIISVILPKIGQSLPDDIIVALQVYIVSSETSRVSIDIIVEVNSVVGKKQAESLVQHLATLIKQFFDKNEWVSPQCNLAVFEKDNFIPIAPHNRGN